MIVGRLLSVCVSCFSLAFGLVLAVLPCFGREIGPGRFVGVLGDAANVGRFELGPAMEGQLSGTFERISVQDNDVVSWQASVRLNQVAGDRWRIEVQGHPDYGRIVSELSRFDTPNGEAFLGAFSYAETGSIWSATVGVWLDPGLDVTRLSPGPERIPSVRVRAGGRFRLWSAGPAGLANNATRSLFKASDGHLWVGTTDGISRFDGRHWVIFNSETAPSLPGWNCRGLTEDHDGNLVVMLKHHGFFRLRDQRWEPFACNAQLLDLVPSGLSQDSEGNLWFSVDSVRLGRIDRSEGLTWWEGDSLMPLRHPESSVLPRIGGGYPYLDGVAYFTSRGMRFFRPDPRKERYWILPYVGDLARIVLGAERDLWLSSLSVVMHYDHTGRIVETYFPNSVSGTLRHAFPSRRGGLWVIGGKGLFYMPTPSEIIHYPTVPASMTEGVTDAFEDEEGTVWIATSGRGLCSFRPYEFESVATPWVKEAVWGNRTRPISLATDPDGELLLAFGAVASRRNDGEWKIPNSFDWFEHKVVSVGGDRQTEEWWAGGVPYSDHRELARQGLVQIPLPIAVKFSKDETQYFSHSEFPLGVADVRAMVAVPGAGMWLGTNDGILVCQDDGQVLAGEALRLPRHSISALIRGHGESVWIGTTTSGVYLISSDSADPEHFSVANGRLSSDRIHCLANSQTSGLWLGGGEGVYWLNSKSDGPAKSVTGNLKPPVHALVEDRLGNLWAGTSTGIYALPHGREWPREDGFAMKPQWLRFGQADGLGNVSTESGHSPAAVETSDGYVNVCMQGELVRFDPAHLLRDRMDGPKILIHAIDDGFRSYWPDNVSRFDGSPDEVLELPPGSGERLKISFRVIHFAEPDLIEYRYRLGDESEEWTEIGDQQSVWFFDLGPGDYHFEVSARDFRQRQSNRAARLRFRVLPRFYETSVFKVVIGGAILGILAWMHQFRVRRRMQMESMKGQLRLESERRRIAQDMHDEIGASFAQLKILGELAQRGRLEGQSLKDAFARIVVLARSGSQTLREILWSLENDSHPGDDLAAFNERSIGSLLEGTNIRLIYSYDWSGTMPELSPRFRREVLLMVKGLVSNVIRHSQATQFEFRLRGENHEVAFQCIDDGVGFDPNSVGEDSLGLQYIRERTRRWAGDVVIQSTPGQGTCVQVRMNTRGTRNRRSEEQ